MQTHMEHSESLAIETSAARIGGRRQTDAILLAFNYAFDRQDWDVATQLAIEYEKLGCQLPPSGRIGRRGQSDTVTSPLGRLWAMLRTGFAH